MTQEKRLKTEHWDELAKLIRSNGFDVAEFERRTDKMDYTSDETPVLVHLDSQYFFQFITPDGFRSAAYRARFSPGIESLITLSHDVRWPGIPSQFQTWLVLLKRELSFPDPWARAAKVKEVIAERIDTATPELDGPFSTAEAETIGEVLKRVDQHLAQFPTYLEHQHLISSQIAFLVDEAKTTANRGVFRRHLEAGLISWCLTLGLDALQFETVCREVFGWFGGVLHLGWKAVTGLLK